MRRALKGILVFALEELARGVAKRMAHSTEERHQTGRPNKKGKPMLHEFLDGIHTTGRSSKCLGELLKM
jgi:hypothetical protein